MRSGGPGLTRIALHAAADRASRDRWRDVRSHSAGAEAFVDEIDAKRPADEGHG
jgi:hypothetical protein